MAVIFIHVELTTYGQSLQIYTCWCRRIPSGRGSRDRGGIRINQEANVGVCLILLPPVHTTIQSWSGVDVKVKVTKVFKWKCVRVGIASDDAQHISRKKIMDTAAQQVSIASLQFRLYGSPVAQRSTLSWQFAICQWGKSASQVQQRWMRHKQFVAYSVSASLT